MTKSKNLNCQELEFCAHDFADIHCDLHPSISIAVKLNAATLAQRKLETYLKEHGKAVYGSRYTYWREQLMVGDTHQALLINIQEIEKKECEHNAIGMYGRSASGDLMKAKCSRCHKPLKPSGWVIDQ